jgi:hypothetical protein
VLQPHASSHFDLPYTINDVTLDELTVKEEIQNVFHQLPFFAWPSLLALAVPDQLRKGSGKVKLFYVDFHENVISVRPSLHYGIDVALGVFDDVIYVVKFSSYFICEPSTDASQNPSAAFVDISVFHFAWLFMGFTCQA